MALNIPLDISAETLLNYLPHDKYIVELKGTHKRNAYEEILSVTRDGDNLSIELSREGLYDILPESLFHPVDRFENISANEYKEKFAEEYESQQVEEANARKFFAPFDRFILGINCEVNRIKNDRYNDNSFICAIICDTLPAEYMDNRFVKKMIPYMPQCGKMRGNRDLMTLVLRKILSDEGVSMTERRVPKTFADQHPRYNTSIGISVNQSADLYMGCEYTESVTEYEISYWNDDECDDSFLSFVSEMNVFEKFINDYFVSVEAMIRFNISTIALPTRLTDDLYYNYLGYNTNL